MSRPVMRILGAISVLTLAAAGSIAASVYWLHSWWLQPVSLNAPVTVTVAEGSTLQTVA
ncbi:MAG: hypothetical protein RJB13_677, partial [Pseudomonadota bacterium]